MDHLPSEEQLYACHGQVRLAVGSPILIDTGKSTCQCHPFARAEARGSLAHLICQVVGLLRGAAAVTS